MATHFKNKTIETTPSKNKELNKTGIVDSKKNQEFNKKTFVKSNYGTIAHEKKDSNGQGNLINKNNSQQSIASLSQGDDFMPMQPK